jgi:hypothetical protein
MKKGYRVLVYNNKENHDLNIRNNRVRNLLVHSGSPRINDNKGRYPLALTQSVADCCDWTSFCRSLKVTTR